MAWKVDKKIIWWSVVVFVLVALLSIIAVKLFNTLGLVIVLGAVVGVLIFASVVKNPSLGPVWIILALPFERLLTASIGAVTVKPVHVIILAVFLAWLVVLLMGRIRLRIPPVTWLVALFWITGLWSLSVSIEPSRTVLVVLFWLVALAGFWLVVQMVRDEKDLKSVIVVLIIATTILAFFGFYQIAGDMAGLPYEITGIKPGYDKSTFGFPRVHATLSEPLYYGNYLLVPFFISVCYFLYGGIKGTILNKRTLFIISIILLISIALTISRGAYLGLGIGALVLIIWQYKRFFSRDNFMIILATLCLGAVMVLSFFILSDSRARDEISDHLRVEKLESESVVSRVNATERAYEAWQLTPWRGIGLGGYGMLELEDNYETYLTDYRPIVNNQYIETLVETGIFGFILLLFIIAVLFWRSWKAWQLKPNNFLRAALAGLSLGVLAILAQYFTFSTIYIVYIWVFIGLLVAVQEMIFKNNSKLKSNNPKLKPKT